MRGLRQTLAMLRLVYVDYRELILYRAYSDQPVATYSTGMRARLGFAVVLECDSDTLLIDETLGVGDAEFQRKCQVVIEERVRSAGTVVLASHSSAAIRQLCTRAVWLERGHIRAHGDVVTSLAAYERFLRNLAGGGPAAASAGGGDHPAVGGGRGDARAWKSG